MSEDLDNLNLMKTCIRSIFERFDMNAFNPDEKEFKSNQIIENN